MHLVVHYIKRVMENRQPLMEAVAKAREIAKQEQWKFMGVDLVHRVDQILVRMEASSCKINTSLLPIMVRRVC